MEDTQKTKWTPSEVKQRLVIFVRQMVRDNSGAYLNDKTFREAYYRAQRNLLEDLSEKLPELSEALDYDYKH